MITRDGKSLTPFTLKVLLHYYVSPVPYNGSGIELATTITKQLTSEGVFAPTATEGVFDVTGLGRAWISQILHTPLPRTAYVDSDGQEITI